MYMYMANAMLYMSMQTVAIAGPTFCLDEKRGLAVLVTCDYKDTSLDKLDTCNTDAQKMKDALLALDYDVHQLKNKEATKCKVELLLRNLSKYLNRYKGNHENGDGQKKAIIVAFAGHGRKGDYIVTHDDKQLHVPNHIVNRLFKFESPKVRKIPKLFFIDACRGTKQPMPTRGDEVYQHLLGNCRVDYATSPEYVAYDGCKWMQKLAEKLENDDSLQHLVSKVNEEVYRQADSKQQCWTYDRLNTGPLYLKVTTIICYDTHFPFHAYSQYVKASLCFFNLLLYFAIILLPMLLPFHSSTAMHLVIFFIVI